MLRWAARWSNLTTGTNNIDIGANVLGKRADPARKQRTQNRVSIAGIYNIAESATTSVFKPVYIDATVSSVRRLQYHRRVSNSEIAPIKASEAIPNLKPVTFHYKNDEERTPQFGLVAEEVAETDRGADRHGAAGQRMAPIEGACSTNHRYQLLKKETLAIRDERGRACLPLNNRPHRFLYYLQFANRR